MLLEERHDVVVVFYIRQGGGGGDTLNDRVFGFSGRVARFGVNIEQSEVVGYGFQSGEDSVVDWFIVLVKQEDGGLVGFEEQSEEFTVKTADRNACVVAGGSEFDFP